MERSYLTSKQMAEVLKISEHELLELVEKKQIPFEVTDEGTVYQAYRFTEEDVLKAFKPREIEEEKAEPEEETETVKEPEPEKAPEEEAEVEAEQPAEEQGQPEEAAEEEATPEPEQTSEKTDKDPFEEPKEEEPKE